MMSNDNWPMPAFDAGDSKHLHALGVIAVAFVQFERSVESLFLHHPANSAVPFDLLDRYFFALSEDHRVAVTRKFYSDRESDALVKIAANNVLDFSIGRTIVETRFYIRNAIPWVLVAILRFSI
jgi:hypothetical protein